MVHAIVSATFPRVTVMGIEGWASMIASAILLLIVCYFAHLVWLAFAWFVRSIFASKCCVRCGRTLVSDQPCPHCAEANRAAPSQPFRYRRSASRGTLASIRAISRLAGRRPESIDDRIARALALSTVGWNGLRPELNVASRAFHWLGWLSVSA